MKRLALRLFLVLALASFSSLTASADTIYTFHALTGFSNEYTVDITVDAPGFVSGAVDSYVVTCTLSGGNTCFNVNFDPNYPGHSQLSFGTNAGGGFGAAYYFAVGAFGADGNYTENLCGFDCTGRGATLNVSDTPEPASLALLGSGLIGLGGALRRKLVR